MSRTTTLAMGWSRRSVLVNRVVGFVVTLTVIVLGIGVGLAAATVVAGIYDLRAAMITAASASLCALACFALGLAVGQLVRTARVTAGLAAAVITGLYLVTNVNEQLGHADVVRFVSPFYYSYQSRALVPGQGSQTVVPTK